MADDIDEAVKILLNSTNTLFDVFAKYLEDYPDLSNFIQAILFGFQEISFTRSVIYINLAYIYGFIKQNGNGKIKIYNKIFEEYFTNHYIAKSQFDSLKASVGDVTQSLYIKPDGRLNFEKVLLKFQEVIKEKYTETKLLENDKFLEEDLRILFLVFLKPIINGIGFSFKEVQTGEEKRLDVIVVFRDEKFVVELKIWRGAEYHQMGLVQLKKYMQLESINKGYMLIMNKNKSKIYTDDYEDGVMMVWM